MGTKTKGPRNRLGITGRDKRSVPKEQELKD